MQSCKRNNEHFSGKFHRLRRWIMLRDPAQGQWRAMATLLWIIAVLLVIAGIYVILARRDILWGIVLIVLGFLVGPGGVSIFNP